MRAHSVRSGPGERTRRRTWDVVVVGGGPAGSTMAWALAREGISVLVLDRARFPREKVCGDFVEPRGLRTLDRMGCLQAVKRASPLPISHVCMFLESQCAYRGKIPFYGRHEGLPPYGHIIPRDLLDERMLGAAERSGATVRQETEVRGVEAGAEGVSVITRRRSSTETISARLVVGADGTHSIVAQEVGLLTYDSRYVAVSQRAYADGWTGEAGPDGRAAQDQKADRGSQRAVPGTRGESSTESSPWGAAFFFDHDLFPGYGWVFPMAGGRVNIGVGILDETRQRHKISVRRLFDEFWEKVHRRHPACQDLRLCSKPIGGIVKTYGGAGRNYFDGGILVGDAGCFVDPMTGEGIAPAMESSLLGASVLTDALERGRFEAAYLSEYERAFRAYFDPALTYVDLVATVMRNRAFSDFWMKAVARGCTLAQDDEEFARTAGAAFGGMRVDAFGIATQVWIKSARELAATAGRLFFGPKLDGFLALSEAMELAADWQRGWWQSLADDPVWHTRWSADVLQKLLKVGSGILASDDDKRADGELLPAAHK